MGRERGDVTVFFGLSGTGKTTLSTDPDRKLIGDDEHVWTDKGVYNIEGGCYAKAINLNRNNEPEIWDAVRFGSVAENCVLHKDQSINYDDGSKTENTRIAYPLTYIPDTVEPAVGGHPTNVVFLTNDAFGVLPPVSLLTLGQAMFWFVTGYTAKVAGTEDGLGKDPEPTFSACFGGPFLVMHPTVYGKLLAEKLTKHNAKCWLVNTGYAAGSASKGAKRMPIKLTRAIVKAINNGTLANVQFETLPGWNLRIPKTCPGVQDPTLLNPYNAWADKQEFIRSIDKVGEMFRANFKKFQAQAPKEMLDAMPKPWNSGKAKL